MAWLPVQPPPPATAPQYAYGQGGGVSSASGPVGPKFRAYQSGNIAGVSASGGTYVVVPFNTEGYDPDAAYDPTTGRFQPAVEGYYRVSWGVTVYDAGSGLQWAFAALFLNGAVYSQGSWSGGVAGPAYSTSRGSDTVYLNGSTDYIDIRVLGLTSGGTMAVMGDNAARSTFSAAPA